MPGAVAAAVVAAAINSGAIGASLIAAKVLYAVTYAVVAVGISAVTSTLAQTLLKKPKPPTSQSFAAQISDRTITARQPVSARRIIYGNVRVGGVYTFIHTTGSSNQFLNLVITVSGHQIESFEGMYFDGELVDIDDNGDATGKYEGYVKVEYNLGSSDQEAFPGLVAEAPDKWTENHRQRGCAGAYVQLKHSDDKFPNGIPTITFEVKGKNDIYDPRTETTGYTNNGPLCVADYISTENIGLGAEYGTEIIEADLIEAANIADEQIEKLNGEYENRYECNGTLETDSAPYENLKILTGAIAGAAITQGKFWVIRAGSYREPEIEPLTERDFVGGLNLKTLIPRTELFNGVKGVFTSPDNSWQPDDFPAVQVADYVTADNNEPIWAEVTLPMTTSASAAQRIARQMLELQRRQISVTVPTRTIGYKLQPFDTVEITIERYGWDRKTFLVSNMELVVDDAWSVRLDLREVDANAYAWSVDDESVYNRAPTTNLPNAFVVNAPGFTLGDEIVNNATGGVVTNLTATIQPVNDVFVNRYQSQYKLVSDDEWSDMGNSDTLIHRAANVSDGLVYQVRVRSINTLGVRSEWSEPKERTIIGQSALPPAVTGFSVSIIDGAANLSWQPVTVVDLSHYRIKFAGVLSGATWSSSTLLVNRVGKPATSVTVPALVGTYLIKAVDYGGRESETATIVVSNVAAMRTFNAIEETIQNPNFDGVKEQVIVSDSKLELDYSGDIFERTDMFGVADFFFGEDGFYSDGYYYFDETLDLGEVYTSRVTASVAASGVNYNSDVFLRPDFFNVTDFFDVDASAWNIELQIRYTEDDTSSSPVEWSDWMTFTTGDYKARGYQFRVYLSSSEFGITPSISELSVSVDMPDETRADENLTVTPGGLSVSFTPAFRELKGLGISAEDMQTGDYYTLTAKSQTGFTIQFFNSSNVAVQRTFDYVAVGYGRVN